MELRYTADMSNYHRDHAYLPMAHIHPLSSKELPDFQHKVPYDSLPINNGRKPILISSLNELPRIIEQVFDIQETEHGVLFISKTEKLKDQWGNEIPKALLITPSGRRLMCQYPGILRNIDSRTYPERNSQLCKPGSFSEVKIAKIGEGTNLAIKRYKRYKSGERLSVGGLEQASTYQTP